MATPKPTTLIEARWGNDPGSRAGNNWDKTRIVGLELVAEEHERATRRQNYTIGASEAADGRVFTFWTSADGCKATFAICVVDVATEVAEIPGYNGCYVRGRFRIIARGEGDTFAPRLLNWWDSGNKKQAAASAAAKARGEKGTYTWGWQRAFAEHLATQITRRGIKEPAPMEVE